MNEIGKEYGAALFMLACEEGDKKGYAAALDTVRSTFTEHPQFAELLSSPGIPLNERLAVIDSTFSGALPEHVLSYLKLLCEKGRMPFFTESVEEYHALLNASEHISSVRITSAVELTDEEKQKLIKKLESMEKCSIRAEYFVDSSILGGLIVEIGGKIMDGSLRHRLHDVKEVMNT